MKIMNMPGLEAMLSEMQSAKWEKMTLSIQTGGGVNKLDCRVKKTRQNKSEKTFQIEVEMPTQRVIRRNENSVETDRFNGRLDFNKKNMGDVVGTLSHVQE